MTPASPMSLALDQARLATVAAEVPVGCVITDPSGQLLASAHNLVETHHDVCAHAEIVAIREATKRLGQKYLEGCTLYVTLEPCAMCAAAIAHARLARVYFGAYDPKSGGVEHGAMIFRHATTHHKPEVYGGIMEQECARLLQDFFAAHRSIT